MIWCWLLGHQFVKYYGGYIYSQAQNKGRCYRCGKSFDRDGSA